MGGGGNWANIKNVYRSGEVIRIIAVQMNLPDPWGRANYPPHLPPPPQCSPDYVDLRRIKVAC